MCSMLRVVVLLTLCAGPASAQVSVDDSGVRAAGVVIDSRGVHTPGADISERGVRVGATGTHSGVSLLRNGVTARMDCRGGAASISGNNNHLTLQDCSRLSLLGNRNDVVVSLVGSAVIEVPGNRNQVTYTVVRGGEAKVSVLGSGDVVHRR